MEPSPESLALSTLLGKFLEDADKSDTIAEAVKDFVIRLKDESLLHNQPSAHTEGCQCIGWHVMRILKRACNKSDPLYDGMDMIQRMQIQQGATMAMHMVK